MKEKQKDVRNLTWIVLVVLYFLSGTIMCLRQGMLIREKTVSQLEAGYERTLEEVRTVGEREGDTLPALRGGYIMALTRDCDTEYPVVTSAILKHFNGDVVERSRNMLLLTFDPGRDTEYVLPVIFREENSRDVLGFIQMESMERTRLVSRTGFVEGYWKDSLLTAVKLSDGLITYSDEDYLGKVNRYSTEDYINENLTPGNEQTWQFLSVEHCLKAGGVFDNWKKADLLSERLAAMEILPENGGQFQVVRNGLLRTRVMGACVLADEKQVYARDLALILVFGGEFSPLLLAARDMWPVLAGMLVLTICAGVYLTTAVKQENLRREV